MHPFKIYQGFTAELGFERMLPAMKISPLHALAVFLAALPCSAQPSLTIYNQNFATVRDIATDGDGLVWGIADVQPGQASGSDFNASTS